MIPPAYEQKLNALCRLYNDDKTCTDLSPTQMKQMASCEPLGVNYDQTRLTLHLQIALPVLVPSESIYEMVSIPLFHNNDLAYKLDIEGII